MPALRTVLLALALSLALPAAASATVTIGSTAPRGSVTSANPGQQRTFVQTSSPAGGTSYVVPPGTWVVRSVSARLQTAGVPTMSVRFARPSGTGYVLLGHEPLANLPSDAPEAVYSSPATRAVRGGDRAARRGRSPSRSAGPSGAGAWSWQGRPSRRGRSWPPGRRSA